MTNNSVSSSLSLFGKILSIGLAGLAAVPALKEEWGSGQHLQTVQDSIQVAAALASAATSDKNTQQEIAAAASSVPSVLTSIIALVHSIKSA